MTVHRPPSARPAGGSATRAPGTLSRLARRRTRRRRCGLLRGCWASPSWCRCGPTREAGLEGLRQTDLVRILDDVSRAAGPAADARPATSRAPATASRSGSDGQPGRARGGRGAGRRSWASSPGTVPAPGPGLSSPRRPATATVGADVLLDTLAGAARRRGRGRGGRRRWHGCACVASTSFVDPPTSGTRRRRARRRQRCCTSPYRFRVIGDPRTLAAALGIPGGVARRPAPEARRRVW